MSILTPPWLLTCRLANVFFYEENVPVPKKTHTHTRMRIHDQILNNVVGLKSE